VTFASADRSGSGATVRPAADHQRPQQILRGLAMRHTVERSTAGGLLRHPGPVVVAGIAVVAARSLRAWYLRWGATDDEVSSLLPGDELLAAPHLTATRAITVDATAGQVWPWIAQLGQGRGGFYSYDCLENLVGCDIHSADRIVEDWQDVAVGDTVNLYPDVGLSVAEVDRGRALVLRGGVPNVRAGSSPYDFTWSFFLRDAPDGTTRLVVRERYEYAHRWVAALVEPVQLVSFVMSRRMMRGIKERAELATTAA
jgi:hypothetical protein